MGILARYSSLGADELVQTCAYSDDPAAWEEFVRRFHPLIAAVVLRTAQLWGVPSRQLLDDLIQEIYLKLCADRRKLLAEFESTHPNAAFGFLRVVSGNLVRDHFRASTAGKRGGGQAEHSIDVTLESAPSSFAKATSSVERQILIRQIESCLERCLPGAEHERSRTIFWLYYRQGLSAKAIASLPGIGLTTKGVESTILRLTRLLREELVHTKGPDPTRASKVFAPEKRSEKGELLW